MKGGMLHSSVVPVNRHPVIQRFFACKGFCVVRICITQEIPGRSSPLRHGICLTFCRTSAAWTGRVYPVGHCCQRRFSVICRHIAFHIWKLQRKLAFRERYITAFVAVYDGNRFSPVTLTRKYPVSQLKVGFACAKFLFLSHSTIFFFASATSSPSRNPELTILPVATSVKASS